MQRVNNVFLVNTPKLKQYLLLTQTLNDVFLVNNSKYLSAIITLIKDNPVQVQT